MCRHLVYLGPPASLHELLYASGHSLYQQSFAPRYQRHGTVNADGFGVGWYPEAGAEPLRYRRAMPMWADTSFAEVATTLRSGCVLAAVRDATPGFGSDESCAQPFRAQRLLFSHNGAVSDYAAVDDTLNRPIPVDAMDARAPVDSAALFGRALRLWRDGTSLPEALAAVVDQCRAITSGRYNLLATDGRQLAATAAGDSLFLQHAPTWVLLASEPLDDDTRWTSVPDGSLVTVRSRAPDDPADAAVGPVGSPPARPATDMPHPAYDITIHDLA
ncbi:ergothioneine biosynthesis protein EgtC [Lipingzhangella sp. LS1_29]|uniref:Gamma-glutamyl-hercynylcysteine sulfoxide hydrolase n=1 Tax=Lipingzhangella rawalii TaxID=2055835 RepID=A0ABU2H8N8_9ACTN|nr:ergothioneine biosynthesis protein EgtC [Lipingzhangella rawalii]MDS1271638.1 ergothioneine biosynthesis protein EgtC [Lipingzhangella rawalii]